VSPISTPDKDNFFLLHRVLFFYNMSGTCVPSFPLVLLSWPEAYHLEWGDMLLHRVLFFYNMSGTCVPSFPLVLLSWPEAYHLIRGDMLLHRVLFFYNMSGTCVPSFPLVLLSWPEAYHLEWGDMLLSWLDLITVPLYWFNLALTNWVCKDSHLWNLQTNYGFKH